MRIWKVIPLFLLAIYVSFYCVTGLYQIHGNRQALAVSNMALLPGSLAKLLSLEFSGLASDYLMLNTLTFLGDKILNNRKTSQNEWMLIHHSLVQILNLDPRSNDPYVLAETTLPWEADMIKETNLILEKSAKYRPHDPRPYFFLWYNHYYFLHDPKNAARYLEKASSIPGSPKYYATLAARMHLYSGQIQNGIIFLQNVLKETTDPSIQAFIQLRLEALKKISFLEQKVLIYKKMYNQMPKSLADLINKGILKQIPSDPYGGFFYITTDGRVYTTSGLSFAGQNKTK